MFTPKNLQTALTVDNKQLKQYRINIQAALFEAARQGDIDNLEQAIHQGADVHLRNEQGNTAFLLAAKEGRTHMLKHLIGYSVNAHVKSDRGYTAVMWAVFGNHQETIKYLVEELGIHVLAENDQFETASMIAKKWRHFDLEEYLKTQEMKAKKLDPEEVQEHLFEAAKKGDIPGLKQAISEGAKVNAANKQGNTAMALATLHGHTAAINYLRDEHAADLYTQNQDGETLLMLAERKGHYELVAHLEQLFTYPLKLTSTPDVLPNDFKPVEGCASSSTDCPSTSMIPLTADLTHDASDAFDFSLCQESIDGLSNLSLDSSSLDSTDSLSNFSPASSSSSFDSLSNLSPASSSSSFDSLSNLGPANSSSSFDSLSNFSLGSPLAFPSPYAIADTSAKNTAKLASIRPNTPLAKSPLHHVSNSPYFFAQKPSSQPTQPPAQTGNLGENSCRANLKNR